MNSASKYLGVVDKRKDGYTTTERLHLISCLSKWQANLYIFGQLSWGDSKYPLSDEDFNEFKLIADKCRQNNIILWVWMKPGDDRYLKNACDREVFINNAKKYLANGAEGFYLLMDDMHKNIDPKKRSKEQAVWQALLIKELYAEIGEKFKGMCGEHYHGFSLSEYKAYWEPLLEVLPKSVMLTWTGPKKWNRKLKAADFAGLDRPLLFWENYYASDHEEAERAPIYPYDGRDVDLSEVFEGVLIHPNCHYAWNYCALYTAMKFWHNPQTYNAEQSFKDAIMEMGDMFMGYYVTEVSYLLFWVRKIKKNIKLRIKQVASFAKHMVIKKNNFL